MNTYIAFVIVPCSMMQKTQALSATPYMGGFLGSPCVPSPISGIRKPKLPLLPLWEKGAGGNEGQRRMGLQKTTYLSQEIYP